MELAQRNVLSMLFADADEQELAQLGDAIATRRRWIAAVFGSLFPLPELLPTRLRREYRPGYR